MASEVAAPSTTDGVARLCDLFAAGLELDSVPPDTDFFLAGGHSLSALALTVAVERAWGVPVRVRDIFECATPALLAERLKAANGAGPTPSRPQDADSGPGSPVGNETRWLWLERQRGLSAGSAYTIPCLFDVHGDVDVDRLRDAVVELQARHPALRTVFVEHQGTPRAVVRADAEPLVQVDVAVDVGADLDFAVHAEVERPFDLAAGPLFRARLFRRPDGWSLLLVADHLVCDGTGLRILAFDLVKAYREPGSVARVRDDSAPARGVDAVKDAIDHWRRVLSPPPEPLALPVNRPRREPVGATTDIVSREIPPGTVERLRALAREIHAGLFAPVAAAVAHSLAELTGARDVCIGTAVDRRARLGLDSAVGFHVVTVPLRVTVTPGVPWRDLLAGVAAATMDAVDHSGVSLDEIVAAVDPPRHPWRTPLFDVFAAVYPHIDTGAADPIRLRGGPIPLRQGIVELSFQFVEQAHGLRLVLQYDTGRYDRETAVRMADRVVATAVRIAEPTDQAAAPAATAAPGGPVFGGFRFDP